MNEETRKARVAAGLTEHKLGEIIYWRTPIFGEWFKGEITSMDSEYYYVTRLVPCGASGVRVPRTWEVC